MAYSDVIQSQIRSIQTSIDVAKQQLAAAQAAGDTTRVGELNTYLGELNGSLATAQTNLAAAQAEEAAQPPVATAPESLASSSNNATQDPAPAPAPVVTADDAAPNQSYQPGALTFDSQGRVTNPNAETGTNPPVITTIQSQSVNPNAFAPQYGTTDAEGRAVPGGDPGVGAPSDDSGTRQNTSKIVNGIFNSKITPQKSVLDQYSSVTYSLSWYLLGPDVYKNFLNTGRKSLTGFQLLAQSGGAPVATGGDGARNKYFTLDYYLDNLELDSVITGGGTLSAHNIISIKFNVIEPIGVTLIENLANAVYSVYNGKKIPYAVAHYCMVVRFYGWDQNGNLISKAKTGNSTIDQNAIVEKYYPMIITNIKFRLTNKQVEYIVEAKPIPHLLGYGTDIGTIKEDITLTGTTVKDVLVGQNVATNNGNLAQDGRQDTTDPSNNFSSKANVGEGVIEIQRVDVSGTDSSAFTQTQQTNLVATDIPNVNRNF